jgi:ferrochelatase
VTLGPRDGVLLVAHGTVQDLDDLPEFLREIRRGRPASAELVAELRRRYEAIGGSPLLEITRAQGNALARRLEAPVLIAMRLWSPRVEDVLRAAATLGLERLAVVPLAPYSVHVYVQAALESLERVRRELGDRAPELCAAEPWGSEPAFIETWAAAIRSALGDPPAELVLTAHSLPTRAIQSGDPYERQFRESAERVARAVDRPCTIAFQSQGADGGEWLGPDLKSALEALAESGARRVVVAPVGFVAEHVETLYDLDVEAQAWARELGIELVRIRAPDADPGLIEALAHVSERAFTKIRPH